MPKHFALLAVACSLLACQTTQQDTAVVDTANGRVDANRDSAATVQPPAAAGAAAPSSDGRVAVKTATGRDAGTLVITESGEGLSVSGTLRGLPPGIHAMHLHAVGQCDAPAFTSAGGHWNPTARQHGSQNPQGAHLGDLPNITVSADSSVSVSHTVQHATMRGANGLLDADGAAVVIHADADDYRTDPAGAAGARIACGVVQPG